jgi:hypothetical protein
MAVDNSELEARTWNPSTISGLLRAVPEENGARQRAERIRREFPFQILRRDPGDSMMVIRAIVKNYFIGGNVIVGVLYLSLTLLKDFDEFSLYHIKR